MQLIAIFIIRQIIEKSIEFDKPAFFDFVDATQAFDKIKLEDVINIPQDNRIDLKITKLITEVNRQRQVQNRQSANRRNPFSFRNASRK